MSTPAQSLIAYEDGPLNLTTGWRQGETSLVARFVIGKKGEATLLAQGDIDGATGVVSFYHELPKGTYDTQLQVFSGEQLDSVIGGPELIVKARIK